MEPKLPRPHSMSRRECLVWLARAAAVPLAARVCSHSHAEVNAFGNLITLKNESAKLIEGSDAILTRTRAGVACLTSFCTHRRKKLEVGADGTISCPAHNSVFDFSGLPIAGPATKPLSAFSTSVNEDGDISVNLAQHVATGTWAPLPEWARPKK
ncbi:MAG: Rieske (2Fe-2S) protein [Planctomycetota bacterium]